MLNTIFTTIKKNNCEEAVQFQTEKNERKKKRVRRESLQFLYNPARMGRG
jgi:hypothetical protein